LDLAAVTRKNREIAEDRLEKAGQEKEFYV
jgi:hypothetical protein